MRRFALLLLALLPFAALAADTDKKGTKVVFDGLTSTTPSTWVKDKPAGSMRFLQFRLPKVAGDKDDAQVVVFKGLRGSAKANIARWKGQMGGGEGKTNEFKIAGHDAFRLEIKGTYTGAPLTAKGKPEAKKGYKGVFYQYEGPDEIYHVRLVGPAKTVDAYKKGYDDWMNGFKK